MLPLSFLLGPCLCFLVPVVGALAVPSIYRPGQQQQQWQQPLDDGGAAEYSSRLSRGLTGRFLHITDLHPDWYYKVGTSDGHSCHRGKGSSGYFGLPGSDCDSPVSLVNETFRWIDNNLKDEIDFVIWTGDSARHDNDDEIPRTEKEVAQLNELVVEKFADVFKKERNAHVTTKPSHGLSIPIVPTFGNNDIMPHNIFKAGPNRWTKKFVDIWDRFIPEEQRHTFVQGGWFTSEVIPGNLAVISLNTMYLFGSNNAVDGCESKREPGYEQMEWLRVQLDRLRERGMKAILIGHVPPARSGSKRSWDESCWQKYTLWMHQYRDIVVGSLYGHMNIDHFMLQDSKKIKIAAENAPLGNDTDNLSVQSRAGYLASLRDDWSKMPSPPSDMAMATDEDTEDTVDTVDYWSAAGPAAEGNDDGHPPDPQKSRKKKRKFLKKIGGPWAERYSVSLVSPSVVPNYFPTLRVIEYNVTGLENTATWAEANVSVDHSSEQEPLSQSAKNIHITGFKEYNSSLEGELKTNKKKGKNNKKKKKKRPGFKAPSPPSSTTPPGPAYSNQAFSWLGYTQYFANLTKIHDRTGTICRKSAADYPNYDDGGVNPFEFEVEYDTKNDSVYRMRDLTVRSFFKLASRIANGGPNENSKDVHYYSSSTEDDGDGSEGFQHDDDDNNIEDHDNKIDTQKKKKKKGKNKTWLTFLDRAFVGLLDPDDIDDLFV